MSDRNMTKDVINNAKLRGGHRQVAAAMDKRVRALRAQKEYQQPKKEVCTKSASQSEHQRL